MKTFLLTVAACGLLLTGTAKEPLYRDSSAPLAERVDDLLSRMTLREKLGQLSQPLYRSDDTTLDARITRGEVGSLVVAHGSALAPAERDRLQRIAVERSRLGIPVLFQDCIRPADRICGSDCCWAKSGQRTGYRFCLSTEPWRWSR